MLMAKGVAILSGLPETVGGSVVNRLWILDGCTAQISLKVESAKLIWELHGGKDMFSVPMGGFNWIFILAC